MMETEEERLKRRSKELLLGHVVTWGSIIAGLVLAITMSRFVDNDKPGENSVTPVEAAADIAASGKG